MPITKGFRVLVDQAMAEVKTYTVAEVLAKAAIKTPIKTCKSSIFVTCAS